MDLVAIINPGAIVAVIIVWIRLERALSRLEGRFDEHTSGHVHLTDEES